MSKGRTYNVVRAGRAVNWPGASDVNELDDTELIHLMRKRKIN